MCRNFAHLKNSWRLHLPARKIAKDCQRLPRFPTQTSFKIQPSLGGTEKGIKCSIFILRSRAGVSSILCFNSRLALSFRRLLSRISFPHPIRTLHSIPSESSRIFGHWISQDRIRTLFTICTISLTNPVLKSRNTNGVRTAFILLRNSASCEPHGTRFGQAPASASATERVMSPRVLA